MKNSEIHNKFPDSNIRDFLSLSLVKSYESELNIKKEENIHNINNRPIYSAIKQCENEIEYLTKKLEILKIRESVDTLIKMYGWEEFDVSNNTINDGKFSFYMNFIGTKEEYVKLMNQIHDLDY